MFLKLVALILTILAEICYLSYTNIKRYLYVVPPKLAMALLETHNETVGRTL